MKENNTKSEIIIGMVVIIILLIAHTFQAYENMKLQKENDIFANYIGNNTCYPKEALWRNISDSNLTATFSNLSLSTDSIAFSKDWDIHIGCPINITITLEGNNKTRNITNICKIYGVD